MTTKKRVQTYLESEQNKLIDLSHKIHANPELAFKETKAATWLTEALLEAGFKVEKGVCDLPTAFIATFGKGALHVAICAEYDALPEIGHACGHNIIAASALGAGIALAQVADEIGITVNVIGTPAEENGGGKILMLDRGAFKNIHVAMMVHPAPFDIIDPNIIAAVQLGIHYKGKSSHASAFPELGINAADAMTVAQTAIGLLRQHMRSTDRVHGIITKGGDAPNIIPEHTEAKYIVRSQTLDELNEIHEKVIHCFEAGAIATGSKLEVIESEKPYAHMKHDYDIAKLYQHNAEKLGRHFPEIGDNKKQFSASTDMGNVSLVIPSIHPAIGIDSDPAVNHQPEFTACCITQSADKAVMDGALAMAWTVIDITQDAKLKKRLLEPLS